MDFFTILFYSTDFSDSDIEILFTRLVITILTSRAVKNERVKPIR